MSAWKVASIIIQNPQPLSALGNRSHIGYYQPCGTGFCITDPPSIFATCGTWLTQKDHCCYTDAYNPNNITELGVQEGFFPCTSIPNIQNTLLDDFGTKTLTVNTDPKECPKDSFVVHTDFDRTSLTCCPSGGNERWGVLRLKQSYSKDDPQLVDVLPIKCGDFEVFPTEQDIFNSEMIPNRGGGAISPPGVRTSTTAGGSVVSGNVPTSTMGGGGAKGTSTASGGPTSNTESRMYASAGRTRVKRSLLIFGSLVVGFFSGYGV
ncbi:hypothetical protein AA313_de0200988 [Arthrobotrys entomopaga]|nr:hypothetical protein AA313_de0200988 [Arthrobotrys entomopaga]